MMADRGKGERARVCVRARCDPCYCTDWFDKWARGGVTLSLDGGGEGK